MRCYSVLAPVLLCWKIIRRNVCIAVAYRDLLAREGPLDCSAYEGRVLTNPNWVIKHALIPDRLPRTRFIFRAGLSKWRLVAKIYLELR